MRVLAVATLVLLTSTALVACSGDESASPDGSSSGGSSGTSGGGSASCAVLGSNVLADDAKQLSDIALSGDQLVFVSDDRALAIPPTIERIGIDGGGRTTLYAPSGSRRVIDTRTFGDKVFFLEEDTADPVPAPELFSIPVAGGTATRIGGSTFREGTLFGVDATSVHIAQITNSPVGSVYDRVDIGTGATVRAATSPANTGTPSQITMTDTDVFFLAGTTDSGTDSLDLYRFGKAATAQTPTKVLPAGLSALCDIALGGVYTTPTKVACGYSALRIGNHDGTGIVDLIAKDATRPASNILVAADAEALYVHDSRGQKSKTSNLRRISSSGGEITPIACDLGPLQNRLKGAFFPIQTEYEVIVGATHVYWVEMSGTSSDPKWTIRRATK